MQLTELRVGAARTINLGNYESIKIEASVTMEVDPEDDLLETKASMQVHLRGLLEDTYKAQMRKREEKS